MIIVFWIFSTRATAQRRSDQDILNIILHVLSQVPPVPVGSAHLALDLYYCQNPYSTNNSIELNLRLDYILTERSTTTHHKLSVVVVNCPSCPSCLGRQTVQLYSQSTLQPVVVNRGSINYNARLCCLPDNTILIFVVSEFKNK